MKPVRFGSYSSRSTVAGASTLSRLKSTMRSAFLWPPPRKRTVMRPVLLRPPFSDLPSVSALTGLPLWSPLRSTITNWRRPGVVGLNDLRAIVLTSEPGGHVDAMAVGERDDRLLHVLLHAANAAKHFVFAFAQQRVDRRHLDVKQFLHSRLDLRLGGVAAHLENHLIVLGGDGRFFRDDRRDDHVVMARILVHLNRASSASIAALVSTSFSRRKMS